MPVFMHSGHKRRKGKKPVDSLRLELYKHQVFKG